MRPGFLRLLAFVAISATGSARADSLDQCYLRAYLDSQNAVRSEKQQDYLDALVAEQDALALLVDLQRMCPTFEPTLCQRKCAELRMDVARLGPLTSTQILVTKPFLGSAVSLHSLSRRAVKLEHNSQDDEALTCLEEYSAILKVLQSHTVTADQDSLQDKLTSTDEKIGFLRRKLLSGSAPKEHGTVQ